MAILKIRMRKTLTLLSFLALLSHCAVTQNEETVPEIVVGAERLDQYLPMLSGKKIGVCVNQTSMVGNTHLVDTLLGQGVEIVKIFTPEHGFRGTADAGEKVDNSQKDDIPIISLYGSNKKPKREDIVDLDYMVFDIQDVGARFYTYISTMHYVMEACAENNIPLLILDRPNPNGHYVDGPVLDSSQKSFVGMHPIPIVHGLTIGELAQMINGEQWLTAGLKCDLEIIKVLGWEHDTPYSLPVKPSPNLPNDLAITMYPSLCLFEGTVVSVGRGTDYPFQLIGHPAYSKGSIDFTPTPNEGAKYPKLQGKVCHGFLFADSSDISGFSLQYVIEFYQELNEKVDGPFFNDFFDKLAGTTELRKQIENGWTESMIRQTWYADLESYREMRMNYLLYP
jgi:uncharacterized protein YbbC (DUF1343 family)